MVWHLTLVLACHRDPLDKKKNIIWIFAPRRDLKKKNKRNDQPLIEQMNQ